MRKYLISAGFVFAVVFGIFFALEFNTNNSYFSGYDSFYHVGMAKYIMQNGLPHKFPYLQFTTLNENFTDNHLLFHLLLIPFIKFFGEVAGPKLFIVLSEALIFSFLYVILRKVKLEWALLFTTLAFLLEPSDFYFRQAFVRNPAPSLLFLLIATLYLIDKRWLALTILSFFYGWLYTGGGFLFLIVLLVIYGVVTLFLKKKFDFKLIIYPLAATGLSLIINPYFPANIKSIFLQVWQTGIGAQSYAGGEWAPYDTWFWLTISYVPLAIWLGAITIALYKKSKISRIGWTVFFFSVFLLLMQWKSKRFVEYWPFFAIFSGILLAGKEVQQWLSDFWSSFSSTTKKSVNLLFASGLLIVCIIVGYVYAASEWSRAWHDTASTLDFNVDAARDAHNYLINNSNAGDIVFTDDWDVFPLYFFLNQKDYYIVGLDPEFMNQYDPKLYREYAAISSGADSNNLGKVKTDFRAKWVIVASDHPEFRQNLESQPDLFKLVFQNRDYTVFQVK
jgi:hypothetical protein